MNIDVNRFPRWKKLLFSLFPAFLFLAFLFILEVSVRIADPSLRNPFLDTLSYNGTVWSQVNRKYLRTYFPPSIAILPEFKPGIFRLQKPDSTLRVVCLGSSSMFGTPYQMTANIPGIVRKQLRHLAPEKDIEVINLGASAINSNVIRDFLDQVIDLNPTLVLIYMGHNEYYGPEGVGAPPLEKLFPWATRLKYRFRDLSLTRLLTSWFASDPSGGEDIERTLMREVSDNSAVRLDSPDAQRIEQVFQANLSHILKTLANHDIQVIISDIASNLHFPPFLADSVLSNGARLPYELVEEKQAVGEFPTLIDTLTTLVATDSLNASLHYWLGEAYAATGDAAKARRHLMIANDLDLLKFRAPESMNRIIRTTAKRHNVPFVSADSTLQSLSPLGIPGNNLFWEHLHPTVHGYYQIADLFVREIVRQKWIIPQNTENKLLPFDHDSLSLAWLDLAYADLSMRNLTTHWPFRGYDVRPTVIDKSDKALVDIALKVYALQTGWNEGCLATIDFFERSKLYGPAIVTAGALLDEFPYEQTVRYRLAQLLKESGRMDDAVREYERILAADPRHLASLIELGLLEVNRGQFDRSISLLTAALREDLNNKLTAASTIHYGLAGAYANKGDLAAALEHLKESLRLNPTYRSALELQASILRYQKQGHPR